MPFQIQAVAELGIEKTQLWTPLGDNDKGRAAAFDKQISNLCPINFQGA